MTKSKWLAVLVAAVLALPCFALVQQSQFPVVAGTNSTMTVTNGPYSEGAIRKFMLTCPAGQTNATFTFVDFAGTLFTITQAGPALVSSNIIFSSTNILHGSMRCFVSSVLNSNTAAIPTNTLWLLEDK